MASGSERGAIPSIKPEQDEVASYRRSGRSDAPVRSNFNALLGFVIALMVVVMLVGGYVLFELQQKLEISNRLVTQGQAHIKELDSRVAATGTDVTQTLADVKSQVNTNFAEIDKLWKLTHRQNRPDIQKNARDIEKLGIDLGGKMTTIDATVQSMAEQTKTTLAELQQLQTSLVADNEDMLTQVALLRGQVQDQAVLLEANKRALATLAKRAEEAQEAIEAIDEYRRQINQRLIDLGAKSLPPPEPGLQGFSTPQP